MSSNLSPSGWRLRAPALLCLGALLAGCADPAPPLPALKIDAQRVTVSGISSGAYMAHQVHLAFSTRIAGAGLIAGGPYGCAMGQLDRALKLCMQTVDAGPDITGMMERARSRAQSGALDALAGLTGDAVWIFHGEADTTVAPQVTAAVAPMYSGLSGGMDIAQASRAGVAHTFPTAGHGGDCGRTEPPFLGQCGFDAAGEIFRHVLKTEGTPAADSAGTLQEFDQDALLDQGEDALLATTGYVYVPTQCREGRCGLHLVFHGCQQSAQRIDREFVEHSGYNRWADLAGVVVVYPQTRSSLMPLNPKGCWDWWGYTGADYDTRNGLQVAWVGRLLDRLGVHAPPAVM
jgi:poly(3-hydroxybutyrate) depolymerase